MNVPAVLGTCTYTSARDALKAAPTTAPGRDQAGGHSGTGADGGGSTEAPGGTRGGATASAMRDRPTSVHYYLLTDPEHNNDVSSAPFPANASGALTACHANRSSTMAATRPTAAIATALLLGWPGWVMTNCSRAPEYQGTRGLRLALRCRNVQAWCLQGHSVSVHVPMKWQ